MGEGVAGPELADCKARGDRELKNVVFQREDLIVELSKKRGKNWHKMRKRSRCRKMKGGWRNSEEWAQRIILVVAF